MACSVVASDALPARLDPDRHAAARSWAVAICAGVIFAASASRSVSAAASPRPTARLSHLWAST